MINWRDISMRKKYRLGLRALFLSVGVLMVFITSIFLEEKNYYLAAGFTFIALVATLAEFGLADIIIDEKYPAKTADILKRLEEHLGQSKEELIKSIIAEAIQSMRGCDRSQISGTFHLKVDIYSEDGDKYEPAYVQVTPYKGKLGGRKWRFNTITKGVVGRCIRTENPEWVNFYSEDEFKTRMVAEFGYTNEEAEKRTKEARSYWAQPVFSGNELIGVMYFFSTEPQIFPIAVNHVALKHSADKIVYYVAGARIFDR